MNKFLVALLFVTVPAVAADVAISTAPAGGEPRSMSYVANPLVPSTTFICPVHGTMTYDMCFWDAEQQKAVHFCSKCFFDMLKKNKVCELTVQTK